jgi:aminoglycoside 6'-N-acetyltransferase
VGLPVRGQLTVVRRTTDEDVDLLVAWHAEPEVSRYWDDETFTREQMQARLEREPVDAWIIEADGKPVGYLQSWWEEDDPLRGGLDGFLIPEARGRGLMPDAARALARSLLDAGWQYVTVDPYVWNERALRGWRKAGFVEVSRHEADSEHKSPWVLMRFTDVSAESGELESGSADTESGSDQHRT